MEQKPSKATVLGALSYALDLVEGQPEGHALRTARIALRIGRELGLSSEQLEDLYYASVLKDSGCSNNSVRIQKIFGGDEFLSKSAVKFVDWSSAAESIKFAFRHTEAGKGLAAKLKRMASNIAPPATVMREVTLARCTRGADIARRLSLRSEVAEAILCLDEHWDGRGAPYNKSGADIPLLSRILCVAQTFEIFATTFGPLSASDVVSSRSGTWFDPDLARCADRLQQDNDFWAGFEAEGVVKDFVPQIEVSLVEADLDAICETFAMIVDAKSSFTAEHSWRVTQYAMRLAEWFEINAERRQVLRRASLLHDVGKLGVSTGILEKPGRLDEEEFSKVRKHPELSDKVLRRIPSFDRETEIASAHHERLDGKGYWRGLDEKSLTLEMRILTACDVFDALCAKRPYREAMPVPAALVIMKNDEGTAFDPRCLAALSECFSEEGTVAA